MWNFLLANINAFRAYLLYLASKTMQGQQKQIIENGWANLSDIGLISDFGPAQGHDQSDPR